MRLSTAVALLACLAAPAAAQRVTITTDDDARWLDECRNNWGDHDRARACEVRIVPVKLAGRALEVDGRQNGSIRVTGWDGDSVRVSARIQAQDDREADARETLTGIRIVADGRTIRAEGPSSFRSHGNWSVSYTLWVPRRFDLDLTAQNGSLGVNGVSGKMDMSTQNGSVALMGVGGDVHARTQNGSLRIELTGNRWEGAGLDAETQNGSVRLSIPERYAAQLETGTVNGRINTEIPITVSGRIERKLSIPLNGGGTRIRAITTNGSVHIGTR